MKTDMTIKKLLTRAAMTLALMLLTTTTAWAFKTETPVSYTVSYTSNTIEHKIEISSGGTTTASWNATAFGSSYVWYTDDSHALANGMKVKPSAFVYVNQGLNYTQTSTTFTFTAPSNIAITGVTFNYYNENVSASSTSSEPGQTFTVTLAGNTAFTGFVVTYGYISGSCGSSATWTLSKQNKKYTALTISGSGAMDNYGHTTDGTSETWRTNAGWGWDITSVTIPNGITSIGNYAFIGCQQLSSLTIGSGVTTIGTNAFDHCDALTTVTLPASVCTLGDAAFKNCVGLTRVNIQKSDGLVTLGSSGFNGTALQYIVAPTLALAVSYKSATNWSSHASKLRVALGSYLFTVTNEGGTAAYAIATGDDLRNLATIVNGGNAVENLTFRQTTDITLNGAFTPIGLFWTDSGGLHSLPFSGTYDGGDHTISGLNVNDGSLMCMGLFGSTINATVKNIRLVSPSISNTDQSDWLAIGSIVGFAHGGSVENSVVLNAQFTYRMEGERSQYYSFYIGSIIGYQEGSYTTFRNLYFYGGNHNAIGCNRSVTNVGRACKVTVGSGLGSVTPAATDITNGFIYNNEKYYREGLSLTLNSNLSAPAGQHIIYKSNGNVLGGNSFTVGSSDVTLTAELQYNSYTVHFDGNGATGGTMSDQAFTYGTAQALTANAFTRTDYIFAGWATSADGDVIYADQQSVNNLTTTDGGSVRLYAKWIPDTYTVAFNGNGATSGTMNNQNFTYGTAQTLTANAYSLTGYTFVGWATSANGDVIYTDQQSVNNLSTTGGTVNLYAKWSLTTYTITYHANFGSIVTSYNSYTIESATITLKQATRTGYTFGGWYDNQGLTGDAVTTIEHGSTGNVELWAKWTPITYTVHFEGNGASIGSMSDQSFTYDIAQNLTANTFVRPTYAFAGWTTSAEVAVVYSDQENVKNLTTTNGGTVTLYAKWTTATDWRGSGSSDDPYMIDNKEQLDLLAQRVNDNTSQYDDKYFALGYDITYITDGLGETESNYTVIGGYHGGYYRSFNGKFDGRGHTISGIRLYKGGNESTDSYQALFGRIGSNAYIHDIILTDAVITGFNYASSIVGYSYGTVERCHVTDDVFVRAVQISAGCHGGIVAQNHGSVKYCTSSATLTYKGLDSFFTTYGGIVGVNNGTLSNNLAIGVNVPITRNKTYGAIAGENFKTISNNYYTACTVDGVANATGVGCSKADITDNEGAVQALRDNADNSTALALLAARNAAFTAVERTTPLNTAVNIALNGRKLYMDGDWNTLCLPFDVTLSGSPLANTEARTLSSAGITGSTLNLTFGDPVDKLTAGTPYIIKCLPDLTINTDSDWETFATNVSNGTESYEGKLVKLAADINVSMMAGTHDHPFKGVFDGDGHTLTVAIANTDSGSGDENQGVAPFRFTSGATISNLTIKGTISTSTRKYAAGIIGTTVDGTNTIENCRVGAEIHSTINGDGSHGGFVGKVSGTTVIRNCRFDGALTTTQSNGTNSCGGFVGWNSGTLTISNSLYAPTLPDGKYAIGTKSSYTFARNYTMPDNSHNYYTETLGNAQGELAASGNADLLSALGNEWKIANDKVVPKLSQNMNIVDPVFTGVTIDNAHRDFTSTDGKVSFKGNYNYQSFTTEDRSILFLGGNNTLYWPQPDLTTTPAKYPSINAFRAYFQLNGNANVRAFNLNFGNHEATGVNEELRVKDETFDTGRWYTLDGRMLDEKPTAKGLYIHGNKKVSVK